jgi:hypothetical protein
MDTHFCRTMPILPANRRGLCGFAVALATERAKFDDYPDRPRAGSVGLKWRGDERPKEPSYRAFRVAFPDRQRKGGDIAG